MERVRFKRTLCVDSAQLRSLDVKVHLIQLYARVKSQD